MKLVKLSNREKVYASRKCDQMLRVVSRLPEREITKLENGVGFRVMRYDKTPTFKLKVDSGFSLGAVLNLVEIVNYLED